MCVPFSIFRIGHDFHANYTTGSRRGSRGSSNASATSTRSNRSSNGQHQAHEAAHKQNKVHITNLPVIESVTVEVTEPKA